MRKLHPLLLAFAFISCSLLSNAQAPASCTAYIGSPANGATHYINVWWTVVGGATSYDLEYSTDGSSWNNLYTGSSTTYNHNTGATGNLPYYYRVRATVSGTPSAFTNATQYPIYSACDAPELPILSNAGPYSMNLALAPETPVANPAYTTYSIYCTNVYQYVQADGSLNATEVFQTASAWATTTVTGLNPSTNYCFYVKAINMDGDQRLAAGATMLAAEPFTSTANFATGASTYTKFYSPASCTNGGLTWTSTGGCTDGYVGKSGSFNNYFGCYLRTPQQNCTGNSSVIMNFDISNSYFANHPNDKARFYMWVDNAYTRASSVKINGFEVGFIDINGIWLKFDEARTCVNVEVTFDLTTASDLSDILFYIEPDCGYHDGQVFSVKLDNVSLRSGETATACLSTATCLASGISSAPPEFTVVCEGADTTLRILTNGNPPTFQWEYSSDGGANWIPLSDNATYSGTTNDTLHISAISAGLHGNQYHCIASFPCGGSSTSNFSTLMVNTAPSAPAQISGPDEVCDGSPADFSVDNVAGALSYTWTLPSGWTGASASNLINTTAALNSGGVTVTAGNACGSSAASTLNVTINNLPSVSFDPSENQFCVNEGPFTFDGVTPAGGTFSGPGVSGNTFSPATAGAGTHSIVYTYTDGNGCSGSSTEGIVVDLCTGIQEDEISGIEIFPNPFSDFLTVKFTDVHESGIITIRDITGKELISTGIAADEKELKLNLPVMAKGMYSLIFIEVSGKVSVHQLQGQ